MSRTGGGGLRRVLVARLDSLGDVLLAGPAVRAVAARGQVTMLVRTGLSEAAQLLPGVHDVIEYDAPWVLFDPPHGQGTGGSVHRLVEFGEAPADLT